MDWIDTILLLAISVIPVGLFTVGVFMIRHGHKCRRKEKHVATWPVAEAVIRNVRLEDDFETTAVHVEYEYEVRGEMFVGDGIHPGYRNSGSHGPYHEELYRHLKIAVRVRAHYNESDPGEAYIVTGTFPVNLFILLFGIMLCGIVVCCSSYFLLGGATIPDFAGGVRVLEALHPK